MSQNIVAERDAHKGFFWWRNTIAVLYFQKNHFAFCAVGQQFDLQNICVNYTHYTRFICSWRFRKLFLSVTVLFRRRSIVSQKCMYNVTMERIFLFSAYYFIVLWILEWTELLQYSKICSLASFKRNIELENVLFLFSLVATKFAEHNHPCLLLSFTVFQ